MSAGQIILWILRIGTAGVFAGHGWYVLNLKPQWFHYLHTAGIYQPYDALAMRIIGVMDLLIALTVIIKPLKSVLIWAAAWAFLTALIRPLSGENTLEFIERTGNWACPLALYFILRNKNTPGF